ncbi:MAG: helix-turn-helix domain-containing protein [Chloroflexi bacterium]|nr:helix-turn-helix domain-containing protein [Chloroflexota bacterium]
MTSFTNSKSSNNGESPLLVGELSRRTGITTATINYYVRIGVLPSPKKISQTRALYPANFVNLIFKVKELQAAGLNLRGIAQLINADPKSPLAAALPVQQTADSQATSTPAGPISIAEFLEQSELDEKLYDRLVAAGLIRRPRTGPDGAPAHDRRDLTAARAFARLTAAGIQYLLLQRHREYEPLSRAEALFLAEHLTAASSNSAESEPANLVAAFDSIRRYLRILQLDDAYPDWRNPG